jgi:hypothetical protein
MASEQNLFLLSRKFNHFRVFFWGRDFFSKFFMLLHDFLSEDPFDSVIVITVEKAQPARDARKFGPVRSSPAGLPGLSGRTPPWRLERDPDAVLGALLRCQPGSASPLAPHTGRTRLIGL